MNRTLNISQVEEMMSKALANGSKAFSDFINKNVDVHISTSLSFNKDFELKEADEYIVLISGLKGDIRGKSYLIFTNKEADEFVHNSLPLNLVNPEMEEAILLEFDNIITAAVVSTISNIMKKDCYGYIPGIFRLQKSTIEKFIEKDIVGESIILQTNAKFFIQDWTCSPSFIWVFDESILKVE